MSRNEGKIGGTAETEVDAADILAALAAEAGSAGKRRRHAVSCYLSASEGWEKASALLAGAFAAQGLKTGKDG
ncbi:MAG TPA: hypothetical protein VFP53_03100 [Sphingomicrobium sp.]|nr:hypothetical protein [Sphingomicrobium sp.]